MTHSYCVYLYHYKPKTILMHADNELKAKKKK